MCYWEDVRRQFFICDLKVSILGCKTESPTLPYTVLHPSRVNIFTKMYVQNTTKDTSNTFVLSHQDVMKIWRTVHDYNSVNKSLHVTKK